MNDYSQIGSTSNKNIFKKELKSHFLDKLADNYQCGCLLCLIVTFDFYFYNIL
jgi:hypothetical protein